MTKQEPETKISRILAVLASGRSLNRIEALPHGDTVLNTTISTLRNRHNLTILDTWEAHTGPNGSAPVKRYWIPEGEPMEKAKRLLALLTKKPAGGVRHAS